MRFAVAIVSIQVAALIGPLRLANALEPGEVAVIAVRGSRESTDLAAFYAERRGIPPEHICLIDVKPGADLGRNQWNNQVRPAIRQWIGRHHLQTTLRCFVTTWDVPLRIGADSGVSAERKIYLEASRQIQLQKLATSVADIQRILDADAHTDDPLKGLTGLKELAKLVETELEAARERLVAETDAGIKRNADQQLIRLFVAATGIQGMVRQLESVKSRLSKEQSSELIQNQGRLQGLQMGFTALRGIPESVTRDEKILELLAPADGTLGCIRWIDEQLELLKKNETYASFDSELSLLYWPEYPLMRWLPNYLHHRYDASPDRDLKPTLMVARIEAPTIELCRQMIDQAIETERTGLKGKVYLDARGLADPKPLPNGGPGREPQFDGRYGRYDQSLRKLDTVLRQSTDLDVVLDNEGKLFQPGDCPDAALYCGWYSLSKYVDAFKWQPGSVAYHIASGEAATLRNRNSNVWCKRMLEQGVCATLGPVREPYLVAFPLPEEFFPLILSGRYTLAETYYRTKPFNSWVMTLVGDPLYNPYKGRSPLKLDQLPDEIRKIIEPGWKRIAPAPNLERPPPPIPTTLNGSDRQSDGETQTLARR